MAAPTDDAPTAPGPSSTGRRVLFRVLMVLVIGGSFAVWGYALSGQARRDPPDKLDEPAFSEAAADICTATLADIDEMPGALDAVDGTDRANQVRAATARFEEMLGDLEAIVGGTERDVTITNAWLADWRVLIGDRYRYAEAVNIDENAQLLITDTGVSERLDRRITRFANVNFMLSCAAPGDIG